MLCDMLIWEKFWLTTSPAWVQALKSAKPQVPVTNPMIKLIDHYEIMYGDARPDANEDIDKHFTTSRRAVMPCQSTQRLRTLLDTMVQCQATCVG